jgi:hypothetical protein
MLMSLNRVPINVRSYEVPYHDGLRWFSPLYAHAPLAYELCGHSRLGYVARCAVAALPHRTGHLTFRGYALALGAAPDSIRFGRKGIAGIALPHIGRQSRESSFLKVSVAGVSRSHLRVGFKQSACQRETASLDKSNSA